MARRVLKRLFMKFVIWILIVAVAVTVFFVARAAWEVFRKERIVKGELDRVQENLAGLEARRAALETTLTELGTERGIEEEVRKKFPLAKPGEEVIVLLDAKDPSVDNSASSQKNIWQSFLGWFGR